ncbi:MAG: TonB-dependent receptor [Bryobacterales bacterium]|nr:TonB-dependent receptor [Bryobacterales bacterium]
MRNSLLAWIATISLLLPCAVLAQFETAAVLGTITDASGAVVSSANVTLTAERTGVVVTTMTNNNGAYEFLNVRQGTYVVSAEVAGFKRAVSSPFQVTVGSRQRVALQLQIGEVSEVVTVSEAAALVEMDTSSRGTVIGSQQAQDLPLNGRAYADLTLLTPGTVRALRGTTLGGARDASYHVNGLRSSYNNFALDGVENNAYGTSNQGFSNQVVQLSPDAVGEFRVITNNFSAEYGRAGGAVINAAYRSGTNDFHFTLWHFLRNKALNATGFFKPQTGEKPDLKQNQFGLSGGGPIVKNRLFFFADYEGLRQTQANLFFADLPTAQMREGNFAGVNLRNPYDGTPYVNGQVPVGLQTPFARRVLSDLPLPNRAGVGVLGVGTNYETLGAFEVPDNKWNFKLDQFWNEKFTSFFRYSWRELDQFDPANVPGSSGGNSNGFTYVRNYAFAAGGTFTLTPTSLLEVRFGHTITEAGKVPVNFSEPHIEDTYGIRGIEKDDRIGGGLNSQGVTGFTQFGRQSSNPQFQWPKVWNPRVNYSKMAGAHTIKAGWEYQAINTEINDLAPVYGQSSYNGRFSAQAGLATAFNPVANLADFFVGAQSAYGKSNFAILDYRQRMNFFYVQDDWKVSRNLTLNLGLRYEYATPQWEANNRLGNFNPVDGSLFFAQDGSVQDRSTIKPDRNNWGPRIGLAYTLNSKTVIRSAYGISYVHFNRMGGENILGFTGPFVFAVTRNQVAPAAASASAQQPVCASGQPFLTCFQRTEDGFPSGLTDPSLYNTRTTRVNYIPVDTPSPYVQNWHLTIQRDLGNNFLFDVGYVGNRGVNQLVLGDFNQAQPNQTGQNIPLDSRRPYQDFSFIQSAFAGGNTFYHGLQMKIEKRYSNGLYLLNSYTWSKAIDNAAGHLETYNGDNSRVNFYDLRSERGLSSYDIPHNNVTSLIYEMPFGRSRKWGADWNPVVNAFLGGWRTTLISTVRSGFPINLTYSPTAAFQVCSSCTHRPNVTGPVQDNSYDPFEWFLRGNISEPTDVTRPFGNAGRNIGRMEPFYQSDFGLYKQFLLPREGSRVEFRSEFFNLFNQTNFAAPNSNVSSTAFGRVTAAFPARQIQFALKLYF